MTITRRTSANTIGQHSMKRFSFQQKSVASASAIAALVVWTVLSAGPSGAADDKKSAAPKPALTITTVKPQLGRLSVKLTANGTIAAWQEASIGAESSGLRLTQVNANVGDVVRAGQVLAVFAPESIQADLAQARANLVEAEANASDAAGNAERARTLQNSGALSTQQINQYQTSEQTAKARVEAAKALLSVQQLRLKKTQVLAPDSGIISSRNATVGAVLASGTELFRMIRQGRLEWRAEVTSAELGRLSPGTPALITAASGAQIRGKVRMIAPTVDPQTRTALVYVDLPTTQMSGSAGAARAGTGVGAADAPGRPKQGTAPSRGSAVHAVTSVGAAAAPGRPQQGTAPSGGSPVHAVTSVGAAAAPGRPQQGTAPSGGSAVHAVTSVGAIKAGMFANGEFALGNSSALMVPQTAVVVRDGFSYVYRVGADNRVAQVKVQTGRLSGDQIEIVSSLSADARLVASGAGFLNEGDLVRVIEDGKAVPPSAK
jgi:RND family efflux transporter MFP subunit